MRSHHRARIRPGSFCLLKPRIANRIKQCGETGLGQTSICTGCDKGWRSANKSKQIRKSGHLCLPISCWVGLFCFNHVHIREEGNTGDGILVPWRQGGEGAGSSLNLDFP